MGSANPETNAANMGYHPQICEAPIHKRHTPQGAVCCGCLVYSDKRGLRGSQNCRLSRGHQKDNQHTESQRFGHNQRSLHIPHGRFKRQCFPAPSIAND